MENFLGKIIIESDIKVVTGLRIGGSSSGLKVGGVDLNVITDAHGKPIIPGSSLRGKLRTLCERKTNAVLNQPENRPEKSKHECNSKSDYERCAVCRIFGILGGRIKDIPTLTRLQVLDAYLDSGSITEEMKKNLELEYTEIKFETAIDRRSGTALRGSLRQAERVPAGAVFRNSRMVFNIYESSDIELLKELFESMNMLEDDYLGGMGSRGYGRVKLENIRLYWNSINAYQLGQTDLDETRIINKGFEQPAQLVSNFDQIQTELD